MRFLLTLCLSLILISFSIVLMPIQVLVVIGYTHTLWEVILKIIILLASGFLWFLSIWAVCHLWKPYIDKMRENSLVAKIKENSAIKSTNTFSQKHPLLLIIIILFSIPFVIGGVLTCLDLIFIKWR